MASVTVMDGHRVDILDLNAERGKPMKEPPEVIAEWVARRVQEKLRTAKPDVIGTGSIITQYARSGRK